jgi:hypothetical protein
LERVQGSNSNARPRRVSEPGTPCAFFGFVVGEAEGPVIDDKEKPEAGEGECFEIDMHLLTIVVITSIMWPVLRWN